MNKNIENIDNNRTSKNVTKELNIGDKNMFERFIE